MSILKRQKNKRVKILFILLFVVGMAVGVKIFLDAVYVPVIIMYHSVGSKDTALDDYGPKLNVLPYAFYKQMKFLKDHNYKVIPLADFIERIARGERIPHKTIAITFDDGLKNNFTCAYPVLEKYGLPAIIFIPPDYVGKEKYLTWNEIKTMQANNISIGSHTMSQAWLPDLDEDSIRRELVDSKRVLEQITGYPVNTLSYPSGAFDDRVKTIAMEAGYIGAVSTNPGRKQPKNDPYALKRIRISMTSDNLLVFWIETSGYYTFIKEIRDDD